MNAAHIHLMINHFPLIGFFFAFLVLLFGLVRKNEAYLRAGFLILVISGVIAVPAYLTGEPAEEIIEHLPGFSENLVEAHEEAAEFAIWCIGLTAVLSAVAFYFAAVKKRLPKILVLGVVALTLFSLAVVARTNNLGGRISHPELRDQAAASSAAED